MLGREGAAAVVRGAQEEESGRYEAVLTKM